MAAKKKRRRIVTPRDVRRPAATVEASEAMSNIQFDVPPGRKLIPYRIKQGRIIYTFRASKRQGKPEKQCCAYCERAFLNPEKTLNAERRAKLVQRQKKKIEIGSNGLMAAIRALRAADVDLQKPIKSNEEYASQILAESISKLENDFDQAG